ncbi:MAG: hypothetical protein RI922_2743 [Bacteroidota bacterium]|jgi:hypothetical protein
MMNEVQIQIESDNRIFPVGIDLEDSWILGWSYYKEELQIEIELSIWPESPYYEEPLNGNYTCYKLGQLIFHDVKTIKGFFELENIEPTIDPDGSKDWGNIYGLSKTKTGVKFLAEDIEVDIETSGLSIKIN